MADLELTAAIEAVARVFHEAVIAGGHADASAAQSWGDLDAEDRAVLLETVGVGVRAAAPLIERAVRERAAQELVAWADGLDRAGSSALRRLRRHIHMCVQRIGPKMTDAEMVQALQRGDFAVCHLDDAGRAIPPAGSERGE